MTAARVSERSVLDRGTERSSAVGRLLIDIGPDTKLTAEDVERVRSSGSAEVSLALTTAGEYAVRRSAVTLDAALAAGVRVYGASTGFGAFVRDEAGVDGAAQARGLIDHLTAGWGPLLEPGIVRAMMAVRCQTLALGRSGVRREVLAGIVDLVNAGIAPAVPSVGSVGASGDLIPLAHTARVLAGSGEVIDSKGDTIPGGEALARAGLLPIELGARDALSLVNGTACMTAHAAVAAVLCNRLILHAEALCAWLMLSLGCRAESLDARLHRARGHGGQSASAQRILSMIRDPSADESRPLQEIYSIRCAPQILGACRDQLSSARAVIETELNGVTDNPIVCGTPDRPEVLHGGNFQGQQIAFASDAINAALTQTALLVERQVEALCDPRVSGGAPLLLSGAPGESSGMAGAQITATALAAELRRNAAPSAVATIPTNAGNQDIVSMGAMAARVAMEQAERAGGVLAVLAICISQLQHLRQHGRAPGSPAPPPFPMPDVRSSLTDRPVRGDIDRLGRWFTRKGSVAGA